MLPTCNINRVACVCCLSAGLQEALLRSVLELTCTYHKRMAGGTADQQQLRLG
jgi:hypothetical protein